MNNNGKVAFSVYLEGADAVGSATTMRSTSATAKLPPSVPSPSTPRAAARTAGSSASTTLGQVAFTMGFAEGGSGGAVGEQRTGVFLASIVPEPSAIGGALVRGEITLLRRPRA